MTREEKQKAIDALKVSAPVMTVTQEEFNDYIQTLNKIMDWLEQEPCDDAISRRAALNCLTATKLKKFDFILQARAEIKKLPPVTPAEKAGHWIEHEHNGIAHIECSECSSWFLRAHLLRNSYCPNCGAKMQEVEE